MFNGPPAALPLEHRTAVPGDSADRLDLNRARPLLAVHRPTDEGAVDGRRDPIEPEQRASRRQMDWVGYGSRGEGGGGEDYEETEDRHDGFQLGDGGTESTAWNHRYRFWGEWRDDGVGIAS